MAKPSLFSPLKSARFLFKKPKTLRYPFELKEPAGRYRGFHLNDWDTCTGCGNCADICPNEAIDMVKITELASKPEEGKKNERPQLDYGRCCFCGLCVDICPPGSLRLSRDYFHIHFNTGSFVFLPRDEKSEQEKFLPAEKYSVLKASLSHRKQDYEGFVSDLDYALFEPERVPMPEVAPDERKLSFIEQVIGYNREEAKKEASRCLECKLCEEACPAHLKISEYIQAIYEDKPDASLRKIFEDNPIPAICGRICMKYCEDACSLRLRGESLAIRWLKRYVSDTIQDYKTALEQSFKTPSGKRIAVIGAGPSGLSVAYFLTLKGHYVVVFDALPGGGGMIRIGPPLYRLPLESIDKDVNYIASLGAEFRFNTKIGRDISFQDLLKKYDAVYIGTGLTESRSTRVRNSEKCLKALEFLSDNKIGEQRTVGKNIIVIGGGNVAMDVAREALRLQHMQYPKHHVMTKAVSLESWDEMPATKEEIEEAKEEGIQFHPAWGPKEVVLDNDGHVKGLLCKKVKSVFDPQGRFAPTFYEGQEMLLEADMIIEAIGQAPDFSFIPKKLFDQLKFTKFRKVKVDKNGMTSIQGVFAGGDIVNMNLDAVTAIADAKAASEGIDRFI
ncbi:FAD-dependent oxidoreductase [bacterium]|nr:FAD-dependent oxidoreductase [bacterium]RQV97987.1 MAG: 4Fe-4S dicluster domain-containing protein [bacterium]